MTDLCVRLVGAVTVCRDGRCHAGRDLGSRKARTLVALLGVDRGRLVTMDRVVEVLWGDRPPRHPAANVATLVSRLRAAFGPDLVRCGRGGYRLGDAVRTDLGDAATTLTEAQALLAAGTPRKALTRAAGTLDLLGASLRGAAVYGVVPVSGVLADQADAAWSEPARTAHRELLRRGRHTAATAALRMADHATAVAVAQAAVATDPLDEVACRMLMRAHCSAAEPGRALWAYEHLRVTLARELGCDPARATRDLHVAILRDGQCYGARSA